MLLFSKTVFFPILFVYIALISCIYFLNIKTGNSWQCFICLRYDSHVTPPANLLNKPDDIIIIFIEGFYLFADAHMSGPVYSCGISSEIHANDVTKKV